MSLFPVRITNFFKGPIWAGIYGGLRLLSFIILLDFSAYGVALEMPILLNEAILKYGILGNIIGGLGTFAVIGAYLIVCFEMFYRADRT